jgi:hypothetical protein
MSERYARLREKYATLLAVQQSELDNLFAGGKHGGGVIKAQMVLVQMVLDDLKVAAIRVPVLDYSGFLPERKSLYSRFKEWCKQ